MAYSTLATQADDPTAGPDHTYFEQVGANFTALRSAFGARISNTAAQTLSSGTTTYQVLLPTVDWDSTPTLTSTVNRLTIPVGWGGLWLVSPCCTAVGTTVGAASLQIKVRVSGATDVWDAYHDHTAGAGSLYPSMSAPFPVQLVAGDYLELFVVAVGLLGGISSPTLREDLGVSLSADWLSP